MECRIDKVRCKGAKGWDSRRKNSRGGKKIEIYARQNKQNETEKRCKDRMGFKPRRRVYRSTIRSMHPFPDWGCGA